MYIQHIINRFIYYKTNLNITLRHRMEMLKQKPCVSTEGETLPAILCN